MYDDNCKKDYRPEDCKEKEDDCKKEPKKIDNESCVSINIFCDKCKNGHKDGHDDCKKEYKPDDKTCVIVNIYCDSCKK